MPPCRLPVRLLIPLASSGGHRWSAGCTLGREPGDVRPCCSVRWITTLSRSVA